MDVHLAQELLNELGSSLENLETQQAALLQFLKDEGIVSDERLAPYLNQAGNASNVRWRAAHVRLEHIFSAAAAQAAQKEQQTAKPEEHRTSETRTPHQGEKQDGATEKSGGAGTKRVADEKDKSESAEAKDEQHENEAKTNGAETKPATQPREKDAA